jgi:hypothetical protein
VTNEDKHGEHGGHEEEIPLFFFALSVLSVSPVFISYSFPEGVAHA